MQSIVLVEIVFLHLDNQILTSFDEKDLIELQLPRSAQCLCVSFSDAISISPD